MKSKESAGGPGQDPALEQALMKRAGEGSLSCADAFLAAYETGVAPIKAGAAADYLKLHLVRCQLGLFGYPGKKIVKPPERLDPVLERAVRDASREGRISCAAAWEVAHRLGVSKMHVSAACEALGIRVKPCQIGAF
ncbi:MAG: hypothetical protein JRI97_09340 [Deltaproteobacteria bacterium]|nr:hypothetical protein [Deltaproteobacteria bacterium]